MSTKLEQFIESWVEDWGPIVTAFCQTTGLSRTEALLFMMYHQTGLVREAMDRMATNATQVLKTAERQLKAIDDLERDDWT